MRVWVSSLSRKDEINVASSMPKHTRNDVCFGHLFLHPMMRTDLSGVPPRQFTQKRGMQLLAHSRRMLRKQHAGASGAWMRANIHCSIMHARPALSILILHTGYCCTRGSVCLQLRRTPSVQRRSGRSLNPVARRCTRTYRTAHMHGPRGSRHMLHSQPLWLSDVPVDSVF